jgi:hypothetical protein
MRLRLLRRISTAFTLGLTFDGLRRALREADIVESHVPYPFLTQYLRVPYVVYEAGWIRSLGNTAFSRPSYGNWIRNWALRGYRKSRGVVYTNVDMGPILRRVLPDTPHHFIPFAIDTDRYAPQDASDVRQQLSSKRFLVLGMARQNYVIKGSDRLLHAFHRFHRVHPDSHLLLCRWGENLEESRGLIEHLGIGNAVTWLPFLPKSKLILLYNAVDVAFDQFLIGAWGTSFPECMACGTPCYLYWDAESVERELGDPPPTRSVSREEEIEAALHLAYANYTELEEWGKRCRGWAVRTHGLIPVGLQHEAMLRGIGESLIP